MESKLRLLVSVFTLVLVVGSSVLLARQVTVPADPPCAVTLPNGQGAFREQPSPGLYGTGALSVAPWPNGTVVFEPNGPGFVMRDGSLGMKWGWRRGVRGQLKIEGRRLDGAAPPLESQIACCGYGDIGFQPTYLIFPLPGCWEVTGRVGDASLTFVTRVVKVGTGPSTIGDPAPEICGRSVNCSRQAR